MIPAHPGEPAAPHDLWSAWHPDPLVIGALLLTAWLYWRGHALGRPLAGSSRAWCFCGGLLTLGVALLSPLDVLSAALASAHMAQHLLLTIVAAPLLALSAPWTTLVRGTPRTVRRAIARWRLRLRLTRRHTRLLHHPATAWLLHVGTLWFWHAAVPYDAALDNDVIHSVEHASFLLTGLLFWAVVINSRRTSPGFGVILLFAVSMHSVFLSALLTFASTPWYRGYAETTYVWGLDPLSDQHLAGVIMWIPGGLVYLAAALMLLTTWIRDSELTDRAQLSPKPPAPGTRHPARD